MNNTNTKSQKLPFCHFCYYYYYYSTCAVFPLISQFKIKFIHNYVDVNFPFCEFPLNKCKENEKEIEEIKLKGLSESQRGFFFLFFIR